MNGLDYIESRLRTRDPVERFRGFRDDPRLRELLPEVYRLRDVPQPPEHHPEGDALVHTLLAVKALPPEADPRLAWAALLHDVGKAETTREIGGRIRAFGHDRAGAQIAERMLRRLGMAEEDREAVLWLVRNHMFALSWQVEDRRVLTPRQKRFLRHPLVPLLLALMEIDARAAGNSPSKLEQAAFYRQVREKLEREEGELKY